MSHCNLRVNGAMSSDRRCRFPRYMRFAWNSSVESAAERAVEVALEAAVNEWHASVNDGDRTPAAGSAPRPSTRWPGAERRRRSTAVAYEIGIDQSGASRLVKSAVAAGYLTLRPSEADGRRREAALTPLGRTLLDQAHEWQEQVFERLTEGWSEQRRREFQRAMEELIDRSYALDA